VAQMLGTANGKIGFFMDGGQISEFMMQLVALDLWGVAKAELKGDKPVEVRCAVADFDVKNGVMNTNAFVFDTRDVVVTGNGTINLNTEEMDLKLKPQPKDRKLGSLRTPLHIKGTFSAPDVGPDMSKLVARGAGTIAMGILNPLLAILPILEEGKGKDSPCGELIAQATKSSKAKPTATTKAVEEQGKRASAAKKEQEKADDEKKAEAKAERRSAATGRTAPPQNPEK